MLIFPNQMALLQAHPYFAHISSKDMTWFLTCMDGELKTVKAGTVLCEEGAKMEFVPVVLEGSTDVDIPRFSTWQRIESESGLSHSIIALVSPVSCKAVTDCFVIYLRVMRLLKPCNYHCDFHVGVTEKI